MWDYFPSSRNPRSGRSLSAPGGRTSTVRRAHPRCQGDAPAQAARQLCRSPSEGSCVLLYQAAMTNAGLQHGRQGEPEEEPPPSPAAASSPPLPSTGPSEHFCGRVWYRGPSSSQPSLPQA